MHSQPHPHFFDDRQHRPHHREPFGHAPGGDFDAMRRHLRGFRRGVRRGDVRMAILTLLAERPMHGYEVMQELSQRSDGLWQPSAGSIYPTLQQLEDEGLVAATESDGRRVFSLTDAGKAAAAEQTSRGPAPWVFADAGSDSDMRSQIEGLLGAVAQVHRVGSPEDRKAANEILIDARRRLYRLLAEEPAASDATETAG
jgi:DNA-binding PadR family transcriptional regulator